MKNLSKLLAVVLAFAMALSMVSFAAYTDVAEDANYSEAVTVLSGLGILTGYEDGSFKPDATITRAEFATVVIRMLGLADSASGGAVIFNDVAADHWANGYIALASQQGIVNGYGDGRFGPEDPVKYQEAIKMVVAALGYTPMADANGGYPGGYKVVASQKGILSGIAGAKDNEAASRAIVAQLAYNSLAVPLMEQTGFGTQTNFETVSSLLLNKLGVTKFEGVVTATSLSSDLKDGTIKVKYNYQITGVKGQSTAKKYTVPSVNTNPYVSSSTPKLIATGAVEEAAKELIDVASVMYVKNADSDDAELVCIVKDGSKNETVSFATEDLKANASVTGHAAVTDVSPERAAGVIEVYTDKDAGETEEYTLNINKVYVNGRTASIVASGNLTVGGAIDTNAEIKDALELYLQNTAHNDVTLLSTSEDEFNVAYITTYKDVQVTRIADRTWKVSYNNLPGPGSDYVVLDETSKTQKFEIYKDGEIASFKDIKEDDVLSIAGYINGSKELEYGKVYIVSDKVEGKVTAKATGKVSVDGTVYKTTLSSGFALGDTAVFFKNYRGLLVAVDTTATAANVKYGFATYIREYNADYGEPAQIRLMNAEGAWETLEFADQVSIDGGAKQASKSVSWTALEAGNTTSSGSDTTLANVTGSTTKWGVNEIVAYDLNSAGKVAKLYLNDTTDVFTDEGISGGNYDADTLMIGDQFYDEDTVIFNVPASTRANRTLDTTEADISIVALASLADGTSYTILAGYDKDDSGILGAALGQGMAAGIDYADNFFVVSEDPMEATNEAGEAGIILTGIKAGEEATLFINTEEFDAVIKKATFANGASTVEAQLGSAMGSVTASTFAMGDVLLYTLNAKGEAGKIAILVEASDIAKASGSQDYNYLDKLDAIGDNDTVLASITGNTNYKFVTGYAKEFLANGNISIYAEDDSTVKTYAFASDVVGTLYDAYTGDGKVIDAMTADIVVDSNAGVPSLADDGDIVFARVVGSRIVEFVVIANSR